MISKQLFVLLTCLFVVMIGPGITMPVLPFYVERLALAEGASRASRWWQAIQGARANTRCSKATNENQRH